MNAESTQGNYFSRGKDCWWARTFWAAAKGKDVRELSTSLFRHISLSYFIAFFEELVRVLKADLSYPIVVDGNFEILDGYHRVAKSKLLGKKYLKVIVLENLPSPDWRKGNGKNVPEINK